MTFDELDFAKGFLGIDTELELDSIKEFRKVSEYKNDEHGFITLRIHVIDSKKQSKAPIAGSSL